MTAKVIYLDTRAQQRKVELAVPMANSETNFVIVARAPRGSTCLSAKSVEEAIAKAERLADAGIVTITDPHNFDFSPDRFEELRTRWQQR